MTSSSPTVDAATLTGVATLSASVVAEKSSSNTAVAKVAETLPVDGLPVAYTLRCKATATPTNRATCTARFLRPSRAGARVMASMLAPGRSQ